MSLSRGAQFFDALIEGRHARDAVPVEIAFWLHLELAAAGAISIVTGEVGRNTDPSVTEAIEDINVCTHIRGCIGNSLKHGIDQSGENIVDFGEKKRQETMVTIAEDREQGHKVV